MIKQIQILYYSKNSLNNIYMIFCLIKFIAIPEVIWYVGHNV